MANKDFARAIEFLDVQNPPADAATIEGLVSKSPIPLPSDYLEFLRRSNGGQCADGNVILYSADEVIETYATCREQMPKGMLFIGTDGGPVHYALINDKRGTRIAASDYGTGEGAKKLSTSFEEFLIKSVGKITKAREKAFLEDKLPALAQGSKTQGKLDEICRVKLDGKDPVVQCFLGSTMLAVRSSWRLYLFDIPSGRRIRKMDLSPGRPRTEVAGISQFDQAGRRIGLVLRSWEPDSLSFESFNVDDWKPADQFEVKDGNTPVAATADGRLATVLQGSRELAQYDLLRKKCLWKCKLPPELQVDGGTTSSVSTAGRFALVRSQDAIFVADSKTRNIRALKEGLRSIVLLDEPNAAWADPHGKISVINLETGKLVNQFVIAQRSSTCVLAGLSNGLLLCGSPQSMVLYNPRTAERKHEFGLFKALRGPGGIAVNAEGTMAATSGRWCDDDGGGGPVYADSMEGQWVRVWRMPG